MSKLPDNREYLVDVILPMVQKIQRDLAKTPRIACDVSLSYDNGLITVHIFQYDDDKSIQRCERFDFFSHVSELCLQEEHDKLLSCIIKHSA